MFNSLRSRAFTRGSRNLWAPLAGQAGVVAFLTSREAIWSAWVHWDRDLRRSLPCPEQDCRRCIDGQFSTEKAYAPVLLYQGRLEQSGCSWRMPELSAAFVPRLWIEKTLEITKSIAELVTEARPGLMALIERPPGAPNNRCKRRLLSTTLKVPEALEWDVRTSLGRAWRE